MGELLLSAFLPGRLLHVLRTSSWLGPPTRLLLPGRSEVPYSSWVVGVLLLPWLAAEASRCCWLYRLLCSM